MGQLVLFVQFVFMVCVVIGVAKVINQHYPND